MGGSGVDDVAGRVLAAAVGGTEIANIYLGDRLGLYRVLADKGPLTSAELALAAGCDERYTREWLQGQVVSGFVGTTGDDLTVAEFALADGAREVFVDELSPSYMAPLGTAMASAGAMLPALLDAFRTGAGVPYSAYPAGVSAQAALNRPAYANDLIPTWLPAIPGLVERLSDAGQPAVVADLGCGAGWSTIEIARAYPHTRVTGYDGDPASIEEALRHAADEGLADRVAFHRHDLAEPLAQGGVDVAFMFECLHDMGYPDRVLRTARRALGDGGSLIVMDEAVDETLVPASDDIVQRFFANMSPLWCLPQGRDAADMDPVGTVMRPAKLRQLAEAAGFAGTEVLPIEHPFFRFYRLTT
ncbi:SAM-dependent methyltransferase [Allocatelliglobosispora scoriae]|uniref:SAM-dependent methyltransferase n=1 Tax=Allocatelliglobosispora scoriae TaxID=643052 RepID=A0A841BIX1_9ACTN|nr:class I SAM-dependent methyltransferase [Allocatelliglobosispora scoriae]MBB5867003.1 SAM-dependent methyltransferase [Allocatelliglobosispora scoriae]